MSVIEISARTLAFETSRSDFTVGRAVFCVACANPQQVRVNGERLVPDWKYIELRQTSKNQFALPTLKIEYPAQADLGILCLSLKVWFNEVGNENDGLYYRNLDDRYALVSWCSRPPESFPQTEYRARFSQNRVATLGEFQAVISRPFVIKLNQRPLQVE